MKRAIRKPTPQISRKATATPACSSIPERAATVWRVVNSRSSSACILPMLRRISCISWKPLSLLTMASAASLWPALYASTVAPSSASLSWMSWRSCARFLICSGLSLDQILRALQAVGQLPERHLIGSKIKVLAGQQIAALSGLRALHEAQHARQLRRALRANAAPTRRRSYCARRARMRRPR